MAKWVKTKENNRYSCRVRVRVYINMREKEKRRKKEGKGRKSELNLINYYIK